MTLEVIKDYGNHFAGHIGKSLLQNMFFSSNCFVKHHIAKKSSLQDRHPCVFFCISCQFNPWALHQVSSLCFWNTSPALQMCLIYSHGHTSSRGGRGPSTGLPLPSSPCPAQPLSPAKALTGFAALPDAPQTDRLTDLLEEGITQWKG